MTRRTSTPAGAWDSAVLLYDSGRAVQGRMAEMLTQDNLEAPFQRRIVPAGGAGAQVFKSR
jgi:hypothetical protein